MKLRFIENEVEEAFQHEEDFSCNEILLVDVRTMMEFIVCKGFETNPFYFYSTLYIKPHFLQKQTNPPFCKLCFSKINMMQIHNSFEYNHISYQQVLQRYQACVNLENFKMVKVLLST